MSLTYPRAAAFITLCHPQHIYTNQCCFVASLSRRGNLTTLTSQFLSPRHAIQAVILVAHHSMIIHASTLKIGTITEEEAESHMLRTEHRQEWLQRELTTAAIPLQPFWIRGLLQWRGGLPPHPQKNIAAGE